MRQVLEARAGRLLPSDPADAFAVIYDTVPTDLFDSPKRVAGWRLDPGLDALSTAVEERVLLDLDFASGLDLIPASSDADRDAIAVLLGLDTAFARISPATGGRNPGALAGHRYRHAREGRLSTSLIDGAVLLRLVRPAREAVGPGSLSDLMAALIRVPAEPWRRNRLHRLPMGLDASAFSAGAIVACAPVMGPGDVDYQRVEVGPFPTYRIDVNEREIASRIPQLLRALDLTGAPVAAMPELSLTPRLLQEWQRVLWSTPRPIGSRLRLVLLGTMHAIGSDPSYNEAVLVDRSTGSVVLSQRKLNGFTLTAKQIREWGLEPRLGKDALDEWLTRGRGLDVLEADGVRIAVLICEDVTRTEVLSDLTHFGVSLVLVPIWSKETHAWYWEHQRAQDYSNKIGSWVAVANSRTIKGSGGPPGVAGTSLFASPAGYARGCTSRPTEAVAFREDGDEVRVSLPFDGTGSVEWRSGGTGDCPT